MEKRITQKDIAERAGVHRGTVSLALRNNPRIPLETRERILQAAQELGYRPDPMLSSLAAYRKRQRSAPFHGVLAWLVNAADGLYDWQSMVHYRDYYMGALQRAEQHGFKLEIFDLNKDKMAPGRMAQILAARGISGILLCPQPLAEAVVKFSWETFSAVTFGYTLAQPRLNTIAAAHFLAVQRCYRELYRHGYRRIGLVTSQWIDQRMNQHYISAYLGEQFGAGLTTPLPPLLEDFEDNGALLLQWIDRYQPDAVITHHTDAYATFRALGLRIPEEIAIACPNLPSAETPLAGVVEDCQHIGATAVDVVVGMIQRGERGIPELPQRIHIEGRWIAGSSIAQAASPAP